MNYVIAFIFINIFTLIGAIPWSWAEENVAHKSNSDKHKNEEHDEESDTVSIGPGKAITAVKYGGKNFKLSQESEKFLKISTLNIVPENSSLYKVPRSTIVRFQNHVGVFVKSNGWYSFVKVIIVNPAGDDFVIKSENLSKDMQVANNGVAYLRLAQLQVSGQGGQGHAD